MSSRGHRILGIYIGGGVPWHTKKWGLRCGHNPKRGTLGASATQKRGNLELVL